MADDRALVRRMKGAALLDVATYEEVEHDEEATLQALAVVAMAAVARAIGGLQLGPLYMLRLAGSEVVGWLVFAGLAYLVGSKLFDGRATWGEVLRTMGFAHTPALLVALAFVPLFGWLVETVVVFWVLWASVVALRQALDVSTGRAVVTGIIAWLLWAVLTVLF